MRFPATSRPDELGPSQNRTMLCATNLPPCLFDHTPPGVFDGQGSGHDFYGVSALQRRGSSHSCASPSRRRAMSLSVPQRLSNSASHSASRLLTRCGRATDHVEPALRLRLGHGRRSRGPLQLRLQVRPPPPGPGCLAGRCSNFDPLLDGALQNACKRASVVDAH